MIYEKIVVPATGEAIRVNNDGSIEVPDRPIIPYIVGDGIGVTAYDRVALSSYVGSWDRTGLALPGNDYAGDDLVDDLGHFGQRQILSRGDLAKVGSKHGCLWSVVRGP